jgi:hypothetical protein
LSSTLLSWITCGFWNVILNMDTQKIDKLLYSWKHKSSVV